jgi:hypothetical protein
MQAAVNARHHASLPAKPHVPWGTRNVKTKSELMGGERASAEGGKTASAGNTAASPPQTFPIYANLFILIYTCKSIYVNLFINIYLFKPVYSNLLNIIISGCLKRV